MLIELPRADVVMLYCGLQNRVLRLKEDIREREPRYADPNDGELLRQSDARYLADLTRILGAIDAALS